MHDEIEGEGHTTGGLHQSSKRATRDPNGLNVINVAASGLVASSHVVVDIPRGDADGSVC